MNCPFFQKIKLPKNKINTNHLDLYCYKDEKMAHKNFLVNKNIFPVKPNPYRSWYEDHTNTVNHAKHCVPLAMANSLGYILKSPATFRVIWDGDEKKHAKIEVINNPNETHLITNHSAPGAFTIQYKLIPKTNAKHFTYIKGIPNIRTRFNVMEGLIESWWFEGFFGVVCLLNQPCDFIINEGDPIASILILNKDSLKFDITIKNLTERDCPMHKYWAWWQNIKNNIHTIFTNHEKKIEILKFFKNFNKFLVLDKNKSWPDHKQYHDFDYANGRHVIEPEKPISRAHFMPKDFISKNIVESIKIDNYNKIR